MRNSRPAGRDFDGPVVGLGGLQGDAQPEAEPASIGASLNQRVEQLFGLSWWKPAATALTAIVRRPSDRAALTTTSDRS